MPWLMTLLSILGVCLAATAHGGQPTVTVTMRLAEAEWQVMRELVLPGFEATCQCRVRALDVPPEVLGQRLRAMRAADRMAIDLFAQDNMRLQELVEAGLVTPLTPEEAQGEPAVHASLMAAGVIGGVQYFVPFRPNVQIAYYNADKFAQYSMQPPRTWPELLAVVRVFYAKEGIGRVLFKGVGGAPTTTQLYEWIVAAGGEPFDFTHPGTVATFQFLAALRPYLAPESRRAKWDTGTRPTMRWPRTPHIWPRTGLSVCPCCSGSTARPPSVPTAAGLVPCARRTWSGGMCSASQSVRPSANSRWPWCGICRAGRRRPSWSTGSAGQACGRTLKPALNHGYDRTSLL